MNKRLIFPGGEIGITNDELNLMPDSNRNGINALAKGMSDGDNCVLTDITYTINPAVGITITAAGYIMLNGEILYVKNGLYPKITGTPGTLYQFVKVVKNDVAEWNRQYRNGTSHNIAEIVTAEPVSVNSILGLGVPGQAPKLSEIISDYVRIKSDWAETDPADPSFIENKPIGTNVRNIGSFSGLDYGGGANGTTFARSGDIVSVTKTADDSDGATYRVVLANAMDNSNYMMIDGFRSDSLSLRNATGHRPIVWRPVTNTTLDIHISESLGNSQNVTVFLQFIQL